MLPLVEDDAWFFDTELLVLAERAGLRIHEVPVDWVDDPDSRVDIAAHGVRRRPRHRPARPQPAHRPAPAGRRLRAARAARRADAGAGRLGMQVAMFALVGVASTLAYAVLYLLLRGCDRRLDRQRCWRCC